MAELSTLARPYAKAVFEYAEAAGALDQWSAMLGTLKGVVLQSAFISLLNSPALTTENQAQSLIDVCGDSIDEKGQNLIRLLAENRRLSLLPFISEQYEMLKAQREKSVDVEVVAAHAINESQQQQLSEALRRRLDRTVNVTVSIDKTLIGGVLVRAGDTIIDGSIRGRLTKLAEALNS